MDRVAGAVSWLFVPGDRPERFPKAVGAGAGLVVTDLQDAVAASAKAQARAYVLAWLAEGAAPCIRINPPGSEEGAKDVAAIAAIGQRPAAVMVPLAEDPHELSDLHHELGGTPVVALVETAVGLERVHDTARTPGVVRIAFGNLDLAADLGCDPGWRAMAYARSRVVIASRAARIAAPVDGVTAAIGDPGRVSRDAARGRRLGFGGKLCIHPTQVGLVEAAYAPTEVERDWAMAVISAMQLAEEGGTGVVRLGGMMVDAPVVRRAEAILGRRAKGSEA